MWRQIGRESSTNSHTQRICDILKRSKKNFFYRLYFLVFSTSFPFFLNNKKKILSKILFSSGYYTLMFLCVSLSMLSDNDVYEISGEKKKKRALGTLFFKFPTFYVNIMRVILQHYIFFGNAKKIKEKN